MLNLFYILRTLQKIKHYNDECSVAALILDHFPIVSMFVLVNKEHFN